MKTFPKTIPLFFVLSAAAVQAQRPREPEVPLMHPDEQRAIAKQAQEFADAIRPVARQASQSTLWVYSENSRVKAPVALATVVGDGAQALTKWSEIALDSERIYVHGGNGTTARAKVIGVYQDEDLALLELDGEVYRPIEWSPDVALTPGRFLVAASPDDEPLGIGVVSVAPRSLREKAFLGVVVDNSGHEGPGVRLERVERRSAAREAGLRRDDILLSVDGKELSSAESVRDLLLDYAPGDRVRLRYRRGDQESEIEAELKRLSEFPAFENSRLRAMEEMGGRLNLVRSGFPLALQVDIKIKHDQCGGPVVDLDGRVIGISVARADRTHALLIPASEIVSLLEAEPLSPELVEIRRTEREPVPRIVQQGREPRQAPRAVPMERGSAERLRRHLEDMERLMDIMRREMNSIDE